MAKSKDDITYGTSQARLSEDEAVRAAYKHGSALEGGKIAESEPVDLFSSAHKIQKSGDDQDQSVDQSQLHREESGPDSNTESANFPSKRCKDGNMRSCTPFAVEKANMCLDVLDSI